MNGPDISTPYVNVTRYVWTVSGYTVTADDHGDRDGKVTIAQGSLAMVTFTHPNPKGAAHTLAILIEKQPEPFKKSRNSW